MTKKKSIKKFIEKSEQSLAARYFALSNTAMLHMVQGGDLDYGYYRANEELQMECGASTTLSICRSGLSGAGGSCSNTSRPAPAR